MRVISTAVACCLLLLVSCSSRQVDLNLLQNRNGIYFLPNETTPFTGVANSFYKNGQVMKSVSYVSGIRQGYYKTWYENGQQKTESVYVDGVATLVKGWGESDGSRWESTDSKKGEPYFMNKYDRAGNLRRKAEFIDSKPNGLTVEYDESGNIIKDTLYAGNFDDHITRYYDDTGNVERELHFLNGEIVSVRTIDKDGKLKEETN